MKEKWLHSGVDKNLLVERFDDFRKIKFPTEPEEDEVYNLFSELVELDGHIAGLVSSYLKNKHINFNLLDVDGEFNSLLSIISVDSNSVKEIVEYKNRLDELIKIIKILEGLIAPAAI